MADDRSTEIAAEQVVVDGLYSRLDELRRATRIELEKVRRQRAGGNLANQRERDAFATLNENRLTQLTSVEERLCFGRLDRTDGTSQYIGRLGLADDDQRRLLTDWRADAARPFYQATAAHPGDVVLRRHLITSGRRVEGVEDDVLDLEGLDNSERRSLSGEGALLSALAAQRTGRMGDIVATIQGEQDAVIRSPAAGVLVVQGGPGTGKTAVALHRAAYLLYTLRDRLASSGVLVIGPSPVFLRYIERVLPSLGETGVVLLTAGELFPRVTARRYDEPEAARLKGDLYMVEAMRRAVEDRQRVPPAEVTLDVEGVRVVLTPEAVRRARDEARRTGKPHNEARVTFVKILLRHLTDRIEEQLGSALASQDRALVAADLRGSVDVRRALNLAWMPLTAQDVLARLLSDDRRLTSAAPWLTPAERRALLRPRDARPTVDDVPLLDELAELIGVDESPARQADRAGDADRAAELEYARNVLRMTGTGDMITSEMLAERFADTGPSLTLSERAAGDRTWAFGHVVVDEAQELSPMMWRLIGRRNPSRSMTVVGDLAQTRSAAGARAWADVLAPLVQDRWRMEELTVSYRTPAQIMRLAAAVLAATGEAPDVVVPQSVREGDDAPELTTLPTALTERKGAAVLGETVRREHAAVAGGRVAVIGTAGDYEAILGAVRTALSPELVGTGPGALDREVAVLTVEDAKGLEFDAVVLVEPGAILAAGPRGAGDLYVAMTRPTRRLHTVHHLPLPAGFGSAEERPAGP